MADNDILCKGINRRWQQAFNLLYQWQQSEQMISQVTLESLKAQLQFYGDPPFHFIDRCAERYSSLDSGAIVKEELRAETEAIHRLAFSFAAHKEAMNLARDVAMRRLWSIAEQQFYGEHREVMTKGYIVHVYNSTYVEPVQFREERSSEIPTAELVSRLRYLDPYLMEGVDHFTQQILRHGTVERLRMPAQRRLPVDDDYLYGDIRLN